MSAKRTLCAALSHRSAAFIVDAAVFLTKLFSSGLLGRFLIQTGFLGTGRDWSDARKLESAVQGNMTGNTACASTLENESSQ